MAIGNTVLRYVILQKKISYDRKQKPKYALYKSTVYTKKRQCDLAFNFLYENLEYYAPWLPENGYASVIKVNEDGFVLAFYTKEGKATHSIEYYRREIEMELPSDVSWRCNSGTIVMTIDEDVVPKVIATYGVTTKPRIYCGGSNTYHSFNFRVKQGGFINDGT